MYEFEDFQTHIFDEDFINDIQDTRDWTSHQTNHSDKKDVELLNRILTEDVNGSSTFNIRENCEMYIGYAIADAEKDIAKWFYDKDSPYKKGFNVDLDEEEDGTQVGRGFYKNPVTGKIEERTSNVVTVVLEKNHASKYGFILTTAYPNVNDETAKPTGQNLYDVLIQTEAYKKANPIEKAYMEQIISPTETDMRFRDGVGKHTGKSYIHIEEPIPPHSEGKFNCYNISEDKIIMSTVQRGGKKPSKLIYSDITEITKKAMCDGEKIEYKNNLLTGGNHAAFKSLHPKTCAVIDTIYNRIRELEGLPPDEKTVVESKYQQLMPITGLDKENEKTNSCEKS